MIARFLAWLLGAYELELSQDDIDTGIDDWGGR